jgi:hypothetical protein
MLVISPFTRNPNPDKGPLVSSDLFDHTSMLRFLETWTTAKGKPAPIPARDAAQRRPGLSAWRRNLVGDMTTAFNFAATPDASVPMALVSNVPNRADPRVLDQCITTGTLGTLSGPTQPIVQDPTVNPGTTVPSQEALPGPVLRPSATCAASGPSSPASGGSLPAAAGAGALPNSSAASSDPAMPLALLAATAAVGLLLRLRTRRAREDGPD